MVRKNQQPRRLGRSAYLAVRAGFASASIAGEMSIASLGAISAVARQAPPHRCAGYTATRKPRWRPSMVSAARGRGCRVSCRS